MVIFLPLPAGPVRLAFSLRASLQFMPLGGSWT